MFNVNFINFNTLRIRTRFGNMPVSTALTYPENAHALVAQWEELAGQHSAIRLSLGNFVTIVKVDGIVKMRLNPNTTQKKKPNPTCVKILYNAGILQVADVYTQVSKALGKGVTLEQLERALLKIESPKDICEAFEVLADRWILHDFMRVSNRNVSEGVMKVLVKFVEDNKSLVGNCFHYNFELRNTMFTEFETKGESTTEARENIIHGADVNHGGDTELSLWELNESYMRSEAFHQQAQKDNSGYHDPAWTGIMLARMFNPGIIIASMSKVLGVSVGMQDALSYLKHRNNSLLLENLQNAMKLNEAFMENFDFSNSTPREAIGQLIEFLSRNYELLTEEGKAVVRFLKSKVKPMLGFSGVYESTIKNDIRTVVTYDQFFENQLSNFAKYMAEPLHMPSIMKAFLANGMYGAGKRRVSTEITDVPAMDPELAAELDEAFNKAFQIYNEDGSIAALKEQEVQRALEDKELVTQSLDAIKDMNGDESNWEEFISDGVVDPTWEAILEAEGLGLYGN